MAASKRAAVAGGGAMEQVFSSQTRRWWVHLAWVLAMVSVVGAGVVPGADSAATSSDGPTAPFPIDERLRYKVSWMGIHCGAMTLESFAEAAAGETVYHIVMTARSSKFFDGVYRVRSRIESWYSGRQMSSVRYHDTSQEKKKVRDDLYEFDLTSREVVRTKDGTQERFPLDADHVHDPLSFLYRMRLLASSEGDEISLVLATTRGAVETVARVVERGEINTPLGKRQALRVVPAPKDGMIFSKSGQMALWVGDDERGIPYRVEFDLPFGKLVAKLVEVESRAGAADQPRQELEAQEGAEDQSERSLEPVRRRDR